MVIKPEVFDGERPRPRRWISDYNEAIVANGWSDKIAIKYLPIFLSRSAKDWFITEVKPHLGREPRWHQIYEFFCENYLGPSEIETLQHAIERSKQRPGETVSNFIPRFRMLILLSNPCLPEVTQVEMIKSRLNPKYKPLLEFSSPQNIRELKTICLKIEAGLTQTRENTRNNYQNRSNGENNHNPYNNRRRPNQRPIRRFNNNRRHTVNHVSQGNEQSMKPFDKSNVECYHCHKMGHFAKECRSRKQQHNSKYNNYSGNKIQHITEARSNETQNVSNQEDQVNHIKKQNQPQTR